MILKPFQRIKHLDALIRRQATGSAEMLAQRLCISKRQVYYYLEELRLIGIEIDYCRHKNSFVYREPVEIEIKFSVKKLRDEESIDILGGFAIEKGFVQCNCTNLHLLWYSN